MPRDQSTAVGDDLPPLTRLPARGVSLTMGAIWRQARPTVTDHIGFPSLSGGVRLQHGGTHQFEEWGADIGTVVEASKRGGPHSKWRSQETRERFPHRHASHGVVDRGPANTLGPSLVCLWRFPSRRQGWGVLGWSLHRGLPIADFGPYVVRTIENSRKPLTLSVISAIDDELS